MLQRGFKIHPEKGQEDGSGNVSAASVEARTVVQPQTAQPRHSFTEWPEAEAAALGQSSFPRFFGLSSLQETQTPHYFVAVITGNGLFSDLFTTTHHIKHLTHNQLLAHHVGRQSQTLCHLWQIHDAIESQVLVRCWTEL